MPDLIKGNAVVQDEWTLVRPPAPAQEAVKKQAGKVVLFKLTGDVPLTPEQIAETVIPAQGKVIVPFSVWLARKAELAARLEAGQLGLCLETCELVEDLAAEIGDINRLPLIAVHIERFPDGRAYSSAVLLRTRYGFRNELRAVGDVLRDQLFFLKRCGFDAYAIRADRSPHDALASLKDFSEPYQGAVDDPQPVWRRHARA